MRLAEAQAGVHQGPVLVVVAGVVGEEAPAGELGDLFADELLLVEAVAQAGAGGGRVGAELGEHEVGAEPSPRPMRPGCDVGSDAGIHIEDEEPAVPTAQSHDATVRPNCFVRGRPGLRIDVGAAVGVKQIDVLERLIGRTVAFASLEPLQHALPSTFVIALHLP
ncbi:MAG TPA: hypothetical protein VFS21_28570 [Roseiflexaceae bacterium]|nr:hypothetical protein [Roseiflexaceae bacterium]